MTLAEIIAKATENPALQKEIVMWAKDTTEGKEILTNHAKVEVDKAISEKTAEIHTSYDNDIFEVLGARKKNDQKTYEFVKSLATELKELRDAKGKLNESEKVKELEAEIKKMKEDGAYNEHYKKIHEEAQAEWKKQKGELEEKIAQKEKEYLSAQVEADLEAGRAKLKFKEGIPQEAIDAMVKVQREELLKNAKIIDGKVIYHKEDGQPMMNKEYKTITSEEIWKEKLGSLIEDGDAGAGSGGKAPTDPKKAGSVIKTGEGDNAKTKLVLDRSMFSTKVEFNRIAEKTLREQGLEASSKEFKDAMLGAYEEYEVSKLDLQ